MSLVCLLSAYIILEAGLYYFERKETSLVKGNEYKFTLKDVPESGVTNWLSQWIEYFILNRYSLFGYKNAVRSNNRIFASIFLTAGLLIASDAFICIFDIRTADSFRGNMTLGLMGFLISSFVLERQSLHKKWEFLYGLKEVCMRESDQDKRRYLNHALLYNIILLEMWSHKSFRNIVSEFLEKNIADASIKGEIKIFDKRTIMGRLNVEIVQYENNLI